jgi:HSP20 family protein
MEVSMSWKSLIPVGREPAGVARRDANPFLSLQQEVERLFDDFARGFPAFGPTSLAPSMDVTETDKESSSRPNCPDSKRRMCRST